MDTQFPKFEESVNPDEITSTVLDQFANDHLDFLHDQSGGAARVIDKLPHNHRFLGLIERLFPEARVIHCTRDPLDTCLSCYFCSAPGSLDTSLSHAAGLIEIAACHA